VTADYVNITGFRVTGASIDGIIYLHYADHCNISNNNISNNDVGIKLHSSSNNVVSNNVFVNNGLYVDYSYQNTVENNIVNGKPLVYLENASDYTVTDAGQVILVNCDNITVERQDLSNAGVAIELWKTDNSKIVNNNINSNNHYSIWLEGSSNNNISNNNVSNNYGAIYLIVSNNNLITNNNVLNNRIYFVYSSNTTLMNNVFVNSGLLVWDSYSDENIVENNTVNGKPLVYLEDVSDCTVIDAGQVILVNCDNITVEGLDLSNTAVGIELLKTTDNCKIANNNVSNNHHGIRLDSSSNNTIANNTALNNGRGIDLDDSSNNIITNNSVSNNDDGIYLDYSSNNEIYLNNFINNTDNVRSYDSSNIWNPTEKITYIYNGSEFENYLGNYWDDYTGADADNDGIGDNPYSMDPDKDNYPLMAPWENYFKPTPPLSEQPQLKAPWKGTKKITQGNYGSYSHYNHGTWDNTYAIDVALNYEYVLAPADGVVIYVDDDPEGAGGKELAINHTGLTGKNFTTVFLHLSKILVKKGSYVKQGQAVAKSGATGIVTGPHLHFHIWNSSRGGSYDSHTIPIERLVLKQVGVDSDFREYDAREGDLNDSKVAGKFFESNNTPITSVTISTDKEEYSAGEMMSIHVTIANPTEEMQPVSFAWRLDLLDYGEQYWITVIPLDLAPGYVQTFTIPWELGNYGFSFSASWYVALYNTTTLEVISEDTADWRYVPSEMAKGEIMPEEIAREIAKEFVEIELPNQDAQK
jgi:parallel beta-helix repeat protein